MCDLMSVLNRVGMPIGALSIVMSGFLFLSCEEEKTVDAPEASTEPAETACEWDNDDDLGNPANPNTLGVAAVAEGYICPLADVDWFNIAIPAGMNLLTVNLVLNWPVSPLDLEYALQRSTGEVVAAPNSTQAAMAGMPLTLNHYVEPGNYLMFVRDRGNDAEDRRHYYQLSYSAVQDPDLNEPNDAKENAKTDISGTITGYISYQGDEDWYQITAPERGMVQVDFTMPIGNIAPQYRIEDAEGNVLITRKNEAGTREATSFSFLESLRASGTYYLVVSDFNEIGFDTTNSYSLTLSVRNDPDENESNDTLDTATILVSSTTAVSNDWSEWMTATGYIASAGDTDWFKLEPSGSGIGTLFDAEINFSNPNTLPVNFHASARLLRSVSDNPCSIDQECKHLDEWCESDVDCVTLGSSCDLLVQQCVGANLCMPDGNCGATVLAVSTDTGREASMQNVNRGSVKLSAPVFDEGQGPMYLSVNDANNDAYSPQHSYEVRVRTAADTDSHEKLELYTGRPPNEDDEISQYFEFTTEIDVHDCPEDGGENCCGSDDMIEGSISYTYDQDWYVYNHPCPDADCMLRINFEIGAGNVDTYMSVYQHGYGVWYDDILGIFDTGSPQEAVNGHCGGLTADDKCYLAETGHAEQFYIGIRDTIFTSEANPQGGTWEWDRDQRYRFCVEKIADGCLAPCVVIQERCNAPENAPQAEGKK